MDPYIVPCFSTEAKTPNNSKTSTAPLKVAPNEELFSLALILIEIAFKDKLSNIHVTDSEGKAIPNKDGDEYIELVKARNIVDSGALQLKMGSREYSDVVKRCLYCRLDGTLANDLSNIEFQRAYYK